MKRQVNNENQLMIYVRGVGSIGLVTVLQYALLAIAWVIYSNTFNHGFVLDDQKIITDNTITKAPLSWSNTQLIFTTPLRSGCGSQLDDPLYRPMTKLLLNVQWNLFDGNDNYLLAAHKFHYVNVALYSLCVVLIFVVLFYALNGQWLLSFFIALLFAVHPVHTEVVANIKSLDEILGLLGVLIALRGLQLYSIRQNIRWLLLSILGFFVSVFSKESSVLALFIFPVFLWFFSNVRSKRIILISVLMSFVVITFLFSRHNVLQQYPSVQSLSVFDNYLVLCKPEMRTPLSDSLQLKYAETSPFASAVRTLGEYIKVFLFPHPLSCDYSYSSMEPVGYTDPGFIASGLLFAGLIVWILMGLKRKDPIIFGLLWFFIFFALTCNVFFLIGTAFGERLLFVPSLGICMVVVLGINRLLNKNREVTVGCQAEILKKNRVFLGLFVLLSGICAAKTVIRNRDWKSNFSLFDHDLRNYPNSGHLLHYYGSQLAMTDYRDNLIADLKNINQKEGRIVYSESAIADTLLKQTLKSIDCLTRVKMIYPEPSVDGINSLGKAYFDLAENQLIRPNKNEFFRYLDSAYKYYMQAYSLDTSNALIINNVGTVLYDKGTRLIQEQKKNEGVVLLQGSLDFFMNAHRRDTSKPDYIRNIGCVYGSTNHIDTAIVWFEKALTKNSLDLRTIQYLGIMWQTKGDNARVLQYKNMASQVTVFLQSNKQ